MELSGMNWLRAAVVALVTVAGGALAAEPPLPPGLSAPKTATKLPLFSLPLVGGGSARAEELRGKVIVARFWATWWDICTGEMPSVQRAQQEYRKDGVPLLAVSLDGDQGRAVKPFLDEHKYTLSVALDPEMTLARAVGVRVAPWTVIVDRSGHVVAGGYGPVDLLSPAFRAYVRALTLRPAH